MNTLILFSFHRKLEAVDSPSCSSCSRIVKNALSRRNTVKQENMSRRNGEDRPPSPSLPCTSFVLMRSLSLRYDALCDAISCAVSGLYSYVSFAHVPISFPRTSRSSKSPPVAYIHVSFPLRDRRWIKIGWGIPSSYWLPVTAIWRRPKDRISNLM